MPLLREVGDIQNGTTVQGLQWSNSQGSAVVFPMILSASFQNIKIIRCFLLCFWASDLGQTWKSN